MKNRKLFILLFLCEIFTMIRTITLAKDIPSPIYKNTANPTTSSSVFTSGSIQYSAKDSIIISLENCHTICLFGKGLVQTENIDLTGEYIELQADSSIIFATFGVDSTKKKIGYPIIKKDNNQYEMREIRYNIETNKMFINDLVIPSEEWYFIATKAKKVSDSIFFIKNGRFTTCNQYSHPHFYFQLSKAKINEKYKKIITGPAFLVVEGVPTPIVIPFGFFSFPPKKYSSGIIPPNYGNEMIRGVFLKKGGYYFAINQYVDLLLTGEIFSKGSWGFDIFSRYKKRYRSSGNISISFRNTILGEKKEGIYENIKDSEFKWIHNKNIKNSSYNSFSSNIDFSTKSYNQNCVESLYSSLYNQEAKFSSVNYTYNNPKNLFSYNLSALCCQTLLDSTLSLELPRINVSMHDIYPFRRKDLVDTSNWYKNIRISYNGLILNNIQKIKDEDFFKKNFFKNWKNGIKHELPVSISFFLAKNSVITFSNLYTEYWYYISQIYNHTPHKSLLLVSDTINYHFCRTYSNNFSINASTKMYGTFKPLRLFGAWGKNIQFRHTLTPSVYLSQSYNHLSIKPYEMDSLNNKCPWILAKQERIGNLNFTLNNSLEMKHQSQKNNYAHKINLIDQLKFSISYNFLTDSTNWSDFSTFFRFKGDTYTLNVQGNFDPYLYDEQGNKINVFRWRSNKGIVRLKYIGTSFSYQLTSKTSKEVLKKNDTINLSNNRISNNSISKQDWNNNSEYDSNGYLLIHIPWRLNLDYSLSLNYDLTSFCPTHKEYPYKIDQNLKLYGSINPTKNWSFNYGIDYDFKNKKIETMIFSIFRKMHCWNMSANIVAIGFRPSYLFTVSANSSILKDLKYTQRSNIWNIVDWGDKK